MKKNKKVLFTIPFAGGNKYSFNKFDCFLKKDFDICHLELPGRGDRISEKLIDNIYLARDDLFEQIKNKLDREYTIFGHSLGGLLGYLLILKIEEYGLLKPTKFIVSGEANPCFKSTPIKYDLPKDSFIKSLKKLGGMPNDFFQYSELFDFFEPVLRADFKISEKYICNKNEKIDTKIFILYGEQDFFDKNEATRWKDFSSHKTKFFQFKGGHFFIFDNIEKTCNIIKQI